MQGSKRKKEGTWSGESVAFDVYSPGVTADLGNEQASASVGASIYFFR